VKHKDAKRENICSLIVGNLSSGDFRSHVSNGAIALWSLCIVLEVDRETKVDWDHTVWSLDIVFKLDISVNDTVFVQLLMAQSDLLKHV
jgi:hypothetical protein